MLTWLLCRLVLYPLGIILLELVLSVLYFLSVDWSEMNSKLKAPKR